MTSLQLLLHPIADRVAQNLEIISKNFPLRTGSACVLARCGVQSSGICVALWPTCVVLSRYVSSPVAQF